MIPGFQQSFEKDIQAGCDIICNNYISAVLKMKQTAELFPGIINLLFHGIGSFVTASVDVYCKSGQILINGVRYGRCLGKRGACLVKIYFFHEVTPFLAIVMPAQADISFGFYYMVLLYGSVLAFTMTIL